MKFYCPVFAEPMRTLKYIFLSSHGELFLVLFQETI